MPDPRLPDATDDELDALSEISEQDIVEARTSALATDKALTDLLGAGEEDDA